SYLVRVWASNKVTNLSNYKQLSEEYYSCNREISKEVVASEYTGTMRLKWGTMRLK
ncbi:hypothetical protein LINPERHAP1_LOCUS41905, partial [Linum perenne]